MSSRPLTYDEHLDLAHAVGETRRRLLELSRMVLDVYGTNNRAAFAFEEVNQSMNRLLDSLVKQAIQDCPGTPADTLYR